MKHSIITFFGQKGGIGKTTLITFLAGRLKADGFPVVVFDSDPQQSVKALSKREPNTTFKVVSMSSENRDTVMALMEPYMEGDHILLVDTSPNLRGQDKVLLAEISSSVIFPLVASNLDIISQAQFIDMYAPLCDEKKTKMFSIVNKLDRTVEQRDLLQYDGYRGVKMFKNKIPLLVEFKRISTIPLTSNYNFNQLYDEFLQLCLGKK